MGLKYTPFKVFHYHDKVDSLPPTTEKILPPIHIRIKPTNICGHDCNYCAYRVDNQSLGKDMNLRDSIPWEKMQEIIQDIIEMDVKAVTFSGGGDPFYYPHLLESAKMLAASNVKFASLTNGARLVKEIAEVFAHHASWLRISIDGWDADSYAQYRGVSKNEFKRVIDNIENFQKMNGKCYLGISLIVDKTNASHVYELATLMKNIGANSVKISACIVSNNGTENNAYHQPVYDMVREQIAKVKEDHHSAEFEVFDAYHKLSDRFNKEYTWCPFLQILSVIGADLNVYSCQDKAYDLEGGLIGSIKDVRFKDFWLTNKKKFFKINPARDCNHHCIANAKNKMLYEYLESDREHMAFV